MEALKVDNFNAVHFSLGFPDFRELSASELKTIQAKMIFKNGA